MYKYVLTVILTIFIMMVIYKVMQVCYYDNYKEPHQHLPSTGWLTHPTISDGACFYHAMLQAISKQYRFAQSIHKKVELCNEFRKNVSTYCTKSVWKEHFSHVIAYDNLQYNIMNQWAGNIEWRLIEDYFDINIIIVRDNTNSIYYGLDHLDPDKKIIMVKNVNDCHYEPYLYKDASGNDKYVFRMGDKIKQFLHYHS